MLDTISEKSEEGTPATNVFHKSPSKMAKLWLPKAKLFTPILQTYWALRPTPSCHVWRSGLLLDVKDTSIPLRGRFSQTYFLSMSSHFTYLWPCLHTQSIWPMAWCLILAILFSSFHCMYTNIVQTCITANTLNFVYKTKQRLWSIVTW